MKLKSYIENRVGKTVYGRSFCGVPVQFSVDGKTWERINPRLVQVGNVVHTEGTPYYAEFDLDTGTRLFCPDRSKKSEYLRIPSPLLFNGLKCNIASTPTLLDKLNLNNQIRMPINDWGEIIIDFLNDRMTFSILFKKAPPTSFNKLTFEAESTLDLSKMLGLDKGLCIPKPRIVSLDDKADYYKIKELSGWSFKNGLMELDLDFAGLKPPFMLKNATVAVAASADDAMQYGTGGMDLTENNNAYSDDATTTTAWRCCGMRFVTAMSNGDTVTDSHVAINVISYQNADFTIYAEDVDDADNYSDTGDIKSRARTTANTVIDDASYGYGSQNLPKTGNLNDEIQEVLDRGAGVTGVINIMLIPDAADPQRTFRFTSYDTGTVPELYYTYESGVSAPTVTTAAATEERETIAIGNGEITDNGGENATVRGFEWDVDSGAPYANSESENGSFGAETFALVIDSLPIGTKIYYRAFATNTGGTGYGSEQTFITKPQGVALQTESETNITTFQSGHGFTYTSGGGSSSDDTEIYCLGTQSLKIVTDGAGTQSRVTKTNISPTIDLTGKIIKVIIRIDDVDNIDLSTGQFYIGFSDDNFSSNYFYVRMTYELFHQEPGASWLTCVEGPSDRIVSGSPDVSAINAIRIYTRSRGSGYTLTAWIQSISYFSPILSEGIVSFTFDDGTDGQYDLGLPILSAAGIKATAYIIPDVVGGSGRMTLVEIQTLQNTYGWEIAGHSYDHSDLSTLTWAQVQTQFTDTRDYFEDNSLLAVEDLAYPYGEFNSNIVLPLTAEYYLSGRMSGPGLHQAVPPGSYLRLNVFSVAYDTSPATVIAAIADSITNKDWLILVFHKIVTSSPGSGEYDDDDFQDIVDYIVAQSITTKTVREMLDLLTTVEVTDVDSTSISLSWTNGEGMSQVEIRVDTSGYPATPSDGTQKYLGSGSSATLSGLTPDTLYYFSIFTYAIDGVLSETAMRIARIQQATEEAGGLSIPIVMHHRKMQGVS